MKTTNRHSSTVHGYCPYRPVWDYYEVVLETPIFIKVEEIEHILDSVRARKGTQEHLAETLGEKFRRRLTRFTLTITGRHCSNCNTVIEVTQ